MAAEATPADPADAETRTPETRFLDDLSAAGVTGHLQGVVMRLAREYAAAMVEAYAHSPGRRR